MKKNLGWLAVLAALCLVCDTGCQHSCNRPGCTAGPQPRVLPPPSSGGVFMPGGQVQPVPPPQPINPLGPPQVTPLPNNPMPQGLPQLPPPGPVNPQMSSKLGPRTEPQWQPGEVIVQLGTPQPIITEETVKKSSPDPLLGTEPTPKVSTTQTPSPPGGLPVGIPQFAVVREGISAGLRPLLDDGLDWLKDNGYRTVIHLREPGTADNTDRKQVEKRGMVYVSLEMSPQKLTKKTLEDFNKLIADGGAQPIFVYDRDGALAGSLWYLHFRSANGATEDEARIKAAGLGLRENREGLHREMWLSARQLEGE